MTQLAIPGLLDAIPTPGRWRTTDAQLAANQDLKEQIGLAGDQRMRWVDIYRWVYHANGWEVPDESYCCLHITRWERTAVVLDAMRWIAGGMR